ncbi:MAG: DUF817 domain-containing protein [Verrucomicrobiales bacterium]|nr:DUF817 domain-containing protein [Verrucomicrobiales bacterium]
MNVSTLVPPAVGPIAFRELLWFGKTQILACVFGLLLLAGLLLSRYWLPDVSLSRSDLLFLYALFLQGALIAFRLEHKEEVLVILAFHLLATLMEWFKTSPAIGSWAYPDEGVIFRVYQVPLFAGFLYSSVGSYIARSWRLFDFQFHRYPPVWMTVVLALLAYGNFFTHHFVVDIRWFLIAVSMLIFGRTTLLFKTGKRYRRIPLLAGLGFVAFAIWGAENLGTYARAWIYPGQEEGWEMVSIQKFWAWYLLMLLSFVLVSLVRFREGKKA